jgi:hypothetical protein
MACLIHAAGLLRPLARSYARLPARDSDLARFHKIIETVILFYMMLQ